VERCWKDGTNFIPKIPQGKRNVWIAIKRCIDDFNGYWSGHLAWWEIDVDVTSLIIQAVLWLKQLVAGLSPWRLGFSLRLVHMGLVGTQWHWNRFFSKNFSFSLSVSFHQCSTFIHLPLIWYNLSNWQHHHIKHVKGITLCDFLTRFMLIVLDECCRVHRQSFKTNVLWKCQ
jgi:hypothetical protein